MAPRYPIVAISTKAFSCDSSQRYDSRLHEIDVINSLLWPLQTQPFLKVTSSRKGRMAASTLATGSPKWCS